MTYLDVPGFKAALVNAGGAGARTAAELPDDRLAVHLEEATADVLGRLGAAGLTVAPAGTPGAPGALFTAILAGVAGYTATLEYYGSQPLEDRDPVVLRYQLAQERLGRLASGKLELDGVSDESGSGTVTGEPAAYNLGGAVNLTDEAAAPTYFNGGVIGPYGGHW